MAEQGRSNTVMAFIIGGLVVAVAVLAYFMFGGTEPAGVAGGGDTNINVETSDTDAGGGSGGGSGGESGDGGTSGGDDTGGTASGSGSASTGGSGN